METRRSINLFVLGKIPTRASWALRPKVLVSMQNSEGNSVCHQEGGMIKMANRRHKHLARHGLSDMAPHMTAMDKLLYDFLSRSNVHHSRMAYHRSNLPFGLPRPSMPSGGFNMGISVRPMFDDDQPAPQFDNVPRKRKANPFGSGMPTEEQLRRM